MPEYSTHPEDPRSRQGGRRHVVQVLAHADTSAPALRKLFECLCVEASDATRLEYQTFLNDLISE